MTDADHHPRDHDADHVQDRDEAARGALYGLFGALFDEPDAEVYEAMVEDEVLAQVERLLAETSLAVAVPDRLPVDDDHDLLRARFNDLFAVGYPDPPVALHESAYRESASWHDVNLDLARAYDYFGVSVDESEREHHDHLRLELEFAGYLARRAAVGDDDARRARRDFLDRHLTVLTAGLGEATAAEANTGPYGPLVELLDDFVAADRDALDADFDADPEDALDADLDELESDSSPGNEPKQESDPEPEGATP